MISIFSKFFGDANEKYLKSIQPLIDKVNKFEPEFKNFSREEFNKKTGEFKQRLKNNQTFDDILPEAFALVRKAAEKTLSQRHFDVQLIGGISLHQGKIVEMKTGEGKTLVSTLAAYLNTLDGKGVHIITVNDYLARRDAVWMGQIYCCLGLSVGCIIHDSAYVYDPAFSGENNGSNLDDNERDKKRDLVGGFKVVESYLRPVSRKEAYESDIVYGTNNEFGFDYLRDSMIYNLKDQVQRKLNYAIIDEVDSILIDEARTPLIISAPDIDATKTYSEFARIIPQLSGKQDYELDEKLKAVTLTEEGVNKIEKILGMDNIYEEKGMKYLHHLEQALKAEVIFKKDRDYVVKNGEIIIVDEFTGRLMQGRRYSQGLHQAIEAKEGVEVKPESLTLATITFQNYFRMYKKLSGMTGTAATSAEEFHKVYNVDVAIIPTNQPMRREDLPDKIYKSEQGKLKAIVMAVKEYHKEGRPVLIGTVSIEKNEYLGKLLEIEGVPHQILNAKNHEKEGQIIAQAGSFGAVTVATNMAGRGVDIVLGGNPSNEKEAERVKKSGGLCVVGTERHEARRIDNQLRGRAGRQGDSGSSQFFISLEDDLLRIFGGDRIKGVMEKLNLPEDQPIENRFISGAIESAQTKIEGNNFDLRKHILEYDDVMNKHREVFYRKRREYLRVAEDSRTKLKEKALTLINEDINKIIDINCFQDNYQKSDFKQILKEINSIFSVSEEDFIKVKESAVNKETLVNSLTELGKKAYSAREEDVGEGQMREIEKMVFLKTMDSIWIEHLSGMERLRDSVRLRAYGQQDPLIEYKNEGHKMFRILLSTIDSNIIRTIFKVRVVKPAPIFGSAQESRRSFAPPGGAQRFAPGHNPKIANEAGSRSGAVDKVGRNDPCPCGKINPITKKPMKYKKCCGAGDL